MNLTDRILAGMHGRLDITVVRKDGPYVPLHVVGISVSGLNHAWTDLPAQFRQDKMVYLVHGEDISGRQFIFAEDAAQVPIGSFTWLSFLGSSLAFGLFHGAGLWFPATLAGVAFALALYHRRKLVDAIVAHATTNTLLGFYAVFTGAWDLG